MRAREENRERHQFTTSFTVSLPVRARGVEFFIRPGRFREISLAPPAAAGLGPCTELGVYWLPVGRSSCGHGVEPQGVAWRLGRLEAALPECHDQPVMHPMALGCGQDVTG